MISTSRSTRPWMRSRQPSGLRAVRRWPCRSGRTRRSAWPTAASPPRRRPPRPAPVASVTPGSCSSRRACSTCRRLSADRAPAAWTARPRPRPPSAHQERSAAVGRAARPSRTAGRISWRVPGRSGPVSSARHPNHVSSPTSRATYSTSDSRRGARRPRATTTARPPKTTVGPSPAGKRTCDREEAVRSTRIPITSASCRGA